jgi:AI-2 transport protein TqsA
MRRDLPIMKINSQLPSSLLFLVGLASLGIAVAFLYSTSSILNTFFLALLIVLTVSPVLSALKRRGAPTWAAFMVTVLVLLVVLLIFMLIVVGAGRQFINSLPEYLTLSENSQASTQSIFEAWEVDSIGLDSGAISEIFNPSKILDFTGEFVAGLVDTFSNAILIGLLIVFMLVDATAVPSKMASYLNTENPFILRLRRYTVLVRRYIGITTIVGLVNGVLDTILFVYVGIEFAFYGALLHSCSVLSRPSASGLP